MEECKICNRKFKKRRGLLQHIRYSHPELNKKEYYDNYLKIEKEGICPVCGKETNFDQREFKYYIHCSISCINKNSDIRNKIVQTNIEKFGVSNNTQLDYYKNIIKETWKNKSEIELNDIKRKTENTCLEKYGEDNPAKSDEIKQKMKNTCLEKYGTEYALQNNEIKEKRRKYNLEKYGVENMFQHPDIIKKIRQIMIKKGFSVFEEDYTEFKNYYKKCISITRINIRKHKLKENWNGLDYYDSEYIKDYYNIYNPNDDNYPNIDHKISIIYGFLNNINPDEIGDVENLCFTKRRHNASKRARTEEEYYIKKSGE